VGAAASSPPGQNRHHHTTNVCQNDTSDGKHIGLDRPSLHAKVLQYPSLSTARQSDVIITHSVISSATHDQSDVITAHSVNGVFRIITYVQMPGRSMARRRAALRSSPTAGRRALGSICAADVLGWTGGRWERCGGNVAAATEAYCTCDWVSRCSDERQYMFSSLKRV
jgi:hypothetical protein